MDGMVTLAGGDFLMGSNRHYPEEAPAFRVRVDTFRIDPTPVTNRAFAAFVAATEYVTLAESAPDPVDYPGALPEMLRAGSLLFRKPATPVPLDDWSAWWSYEFGADWRHPTGPGSSIEGLEDHPVVHVAYCDAEAYATWAGKSLPSEAQWEFAARGGLDGADYAWGDDLTPEGRMLANFWQGNFPHENLARDGYEGVSPVCAFPANPFGLHDMIGNVWEWTSDWYAPRQLLAPTKACCIPENPRGPRGDYGLEAIPRRVLKGGSHLCAPNYCQRYRPAARHAQPVDSSTSHIGFRCVARA